MPISFYRVGNLVSKFIQEDQDEDMEEARGISLDRSENAIIEGLQTFAPMEEVHEDGNSMILENGEFDLEILEEIETLFPEVSTETTTEPPVILTENARRIQEIREFFSIPASVPTRQIPSFFHNHQRVTTSLEAGSIITRSGIHARHSLIELLSGKQDRMHEIYNILLAIDWQEDLYQEESTFSDSSPPHSPPSEEESEDFPVSAVTEVEEDWDSVAATIVDAAQLDAEDEETFWKAVEASQEENFNLVAETQQPRLHSDPTSPHQVSEPSGLRVELAIRSKGAEGDGSELW